MATNNKHKTTLNLDSDLMKLLKLKALSKDITLTELVELYLKNGLTTDIKIKKGVTEKSYIRYVKKHLTK